MIKAIVWDVDGVLLTNGNGTYRLEEVANQHFAHQKDEWVQRLWDGRYEPCLTGHKSTRTALQEAIDDLNLPLTVDEAMAQWLQSHPDIHQPILHFIRQLKNQNHFLGTNQDTQRADHIWEDLAFKNHFTDIFASGHLGHKKPDERFFMEAQKRLDQHLGAELLPSEVLFFDDVATNVAAAQQFGWQAEQYTWEKFDVLPEILKQYGVETNES